MGTRQLVDRAALALGFVALLIGVLSPVFVTVDSGARLGVTDGRVVVDFVDPHSPAEHYGLRAGMVATEVNGRTLIRLPTMVDPSPMPTPDPSSGEMPPVDQVPDIPAPVAAPISPDDLQAIADQRITELQAYLASDLTTWKADQWPGGVFLGDDGRYRLGESALSVGIGIAVLFVMAWWLTTGRAGASLRGLGIPLSVATAAPFLLRPLDAMWTPTAISLAAILVPASMVPLAIALLERVENAQDRRIAGVASATCAVAAAGLALSALSAGPEPPVLSPWMLACGIAAIPGLMASGPLISRARAAQGLPDVADGTASGRLLQSTELAIAGATPAAALASNSWPFLWPFLLWVAAIALAGRFTVRPLARLASRAQLQRDLVIAATEAERARVAADIHDDALQELTLLVRRLDAAGDTEGADLARGVSDRLRAICGDLRLPILDDLGVGPALDWLVLRIERLAGGEVRLERTDGTRPPADVELAFFRVAQEALANAVKHGRPPIIVRYRSTIAGASLSIDDAGAGILPDAADRAERDGHFGLLNMSQRAEGIGAILDVRRWPAGGTHVGLEWRAR